MDRENPNVLGQSPGIVGRKGLGQMGRVVDDTAHSGLSCTNPDCLHVKQRLLEETFRNFSVTVKPPSHIEPPFRARPIAKINIVTVVGGMYAPGVFTKIVCYQVQKKWRGCLVAFGQELENLAAWSDVEWRLTVNNQAYDPYMAIRFQLFPIMIKHAMPAPVNLRSWDLVCVEARSLSPASHDVTASLCGWEYPVRAEVGDTIGSTLND